MVTRYGVITISRSSHFSMKLPGFYHFGKNNVGNAPKSSTLSNLVGLRHIPTLF